MIIYEMKTHFKSNLTFDDNLKINNELNLYTV